MVKVYIWKPGVPGSLKFAHFIAGHASIAIGDKYFSFWPTSEEDEKEKDIDFLTSIPAKFHSFIEDQKAKGFNADEFIEINNLEEVSMLNFWKAVMTERIHYNLLRMNCCVTVALSLRVGFLNSPSGRAVLEKPTGFSFTQIKQKAELQTFLKKTELDSQGDLIEGPPMSPRVMAYYARLLRRVVG